MQRMLKNDNVFIACLLSIIMLPVFLQGTSFQLDNFNPDEQTVDVRYDFDEGDVAGFQFDVTGLALSGASGGTAGDVGFSVSAGSSTVLGFSFTGALIPTGSGLLTTLSYSEISSEQACINSTIATVPGGGSEYSSDGGDCISTDAIQIRFSIGTGNVVLGKAC